MCYAWLVFTQLTRDLFAIAKFLLCTKASFDIGHNACLTNFNSATEQSARLCWATHADLVYAATLQRGEV